jgi:hypothetical protein
MRFSTWFLVSGKEHNRYLEVIGDKKASETARHMETHPETLYEMKSKLQLPTQFIYPVCHRWV